jgi:hypothetical protein
MDLGCFIAGRDNDVPEPSKRRGLFWEWTAGLLGLPDTTATTPLRFQGLGAARAEDRNWEYDAVARRDARMRALNLPPTRGEVVAGIVGDVVDSMKTAVRKMPALKRATEFLARVLDAGPVAEKEVLRLAQLENLSEKTLKRARAKLKVKTSKKGRGGWFLSMTRAKGGRGS